MKTKTGEEISIKEAFVRFKQGVANITPLQKLQNEIRGTLITILGFIVALGACIWKLDSIGVIGYGLILIFFGNIITTWLRYIGMKQQLKFFTQTNDNSIDLYNLLEQIDENKAKEHLETLYSKPIEEVKGGKI